MAREPIGVPCDDRNGALPAYQQGQRFISHWLAK
jgi:hypothetical protein